MREINNWTVIYRFLAHIYSQWWKVVLVPQYFSFLLFNSSTPEENIALSTPLHLFDNISYFANSY